MGVEANMSKLLSQQLWKAARNGKSPAEIRELVERGADINFLSRPEFGSGTTCTPLWIAVNHGHLETVKELVRLGADQTIVDSLKKTTPVQHAKKMHWDDPGGIYDVLTGTVTIPEPEPEPAAGSAPAPSARADVRFCNKCGNMGKGAVCSTCGGKLVI